MAQVFGDHSVHGVSNVDLRVNNGIEAIVLNANISTVQLTNRSTRIGSVVATVSTDVNPATIVLPTVSTLPANTEWSWTGLFFDSTVPVKIVTEANVVLFTAFPNDVVEVMCVVSENNWKVVSHLKDEKKERLSGLLYPVGTDTVEVTLDTDTNKYYLYISDRVLFFNYGNGETKRLYFKEGAFEVPATASGKTEPTYISINDAGQVLFDNTPVTMDDRDRVLIARGIRVKISNVWNLTNFKYMPYLADTDSVLRSAPLAISKFCTFPIESTTDSQLRFSDFDLLQEGINYEDNTLNPDRIHVAAANPGQFYTFYPGNMSLSKSSEVDGNYYYNTTSETLDTVPADKYTIQLLMSSPRGDIWRLYGQELYDSLSSAISAALGSAWDVTGLPTDGVAAAAFIIKGDQYSGSTTLDLIDPNNFVICQIPQQLLSESASGGGSAPSVSGNTVLQENVVVGAASSIKNFNFKAHVPITATGDTVNISVNGVENANTSNVEVPVVHTWTGTQDDYDDLTAYDADTIYNIVDNNNDSLNNLYYPPLLSCTWADHKLNDIHWLRADTFSWQSGDVYSAVYNHLVQDFVGLKTTGYAWYNADDDIIYYTESETPSLWDPIYGVWIIYTQVGVQVAMIYDYVGQIISSTEFVGGIGTYTRQSADDVTNIIIDKQASYAEEYAAFYTPDGHKILLDDGVAYIDGAEIAQNMYNNTGVSWYYVLDIENKRFKLPRTKFGFTGLRNSVGDYIQAGVPNITGSFYASGDYIVSTGNFSGSFKAGSNATRQDCGSGNSHSYPKLDFDASLSSSVYGNSSTVQPPATQMYLYFYVGNYTPSAVTQTAGLNAELFNNKAELTLSNVNTNLTTLNNVMPSAMDYVVEQWSSGANWYRKWRSGRVEQGGVQAVAGGGWQQISLFVTMSDANYVVTTGSMLPSDGDNPSAMLRPGSLTTTYFQVAFKWDQGQYKSGTLHWRVDGMHA